MRDLLALSRKNLVLIKKYIIIFLFYTLALPYVYVRIVENKNELVFWLISFIDLLIMLIVIVNTIEIADEKNNRVLHILCAAPYKREEIVLSKYLFDYMIFAVYWLLIGAESLCLRSNFLHINILSVLSIFLVCSLYRGIMIPFQLKFGYSKTKNIFTFISFGLIFGIPIITNLIEMKRIFDLFENIALFKMDYYVQCIIVALFAVIVNIISYVVSIRIFRNKDLV